MVLRIYVAGRVGLEHGDTFVSEDRLVGRQGRVVLAMLAAEHRRALSRGEIAEELWGDDPPLSWERALVAIISKLRAVMVELGTCEDPIDSSFGCYQLRLPPGTWLDLDVADEAVHDAETALRAGDARAAYIPAETGFQITRRPLLAGESGPWVTQRREEWRLLELRALEAVALATAGVGEQEIALRHAHHLVRAEPLRESGWRLLMRLHQEAGNPAEALAAYEECRRTLAEQLGVRPSAPTEALYVEILGAS
jgi:DNA-binding SARP family transcriptional activator